MNLYFLDTSIIIDYHRNKKEARELLDNINGELTSSYICLAELYEGITRSEKSQEMESATLNFFSSLKNVYGIDTQIAKTFGQIRAHLKSEGQLIEDIDILIAATCIANNLTLITENRKHFNHVPDLKIFKQLPI